MFEACLRRHRYKGTFEFTHVSKSQVNVKRLSTGTCILPQQHSAAPSSASCIHIWCCSSAPTLPLASACAPCQADMISVSLHVVSFDVGSQIVLKSRHEYEVERINIYQDRFLVAHTAQTLMLGDLQTCQLSEVSWDTTGNEKFHFDNPQVKLVLW